MKIYVIGCNISSYDERRYFLVKAVKTEERAKELMYALQNEYQIRWAPIAEKRKSLSYRRDHETYEKDMKEAFPEGWHNKYDPYNSYEDMDVYGVRYDFEEVEIED